MDARLRGEATAAVKDCDGACCGATNTTANFSGEQVDAVDERVVRNVLNGDAAVDAIRDGCVVEAADCVVGVADRKRTTGIPRKNVDIVLRRVEVREVGDDLWERYERI